MKMRLIHLLLPLVFGWAAGLHAQEEEKWIIEGITQESYAYYDNGITVGTNGIAVRYNGSVLVANAVRVDQSTGQAQAEGNVSIQREGYLWKGERVNYNMKTREMSATDFKAGFAPFFAGG